MSWKTERLFMFRNEGEEWIMKGIYLKMRRTVYHKKF